MPAFCIKLDKVNIPHLLKGKVRKLLQENKDLGAHNQPRGFLPDDLPTTGKVD